MCKRGGCVPPPVVFLFKKFKKAGICFVLMPEKREPVLFPCKKQKMCSRYLI